MSILFRDNYLAGIADGLELFEFICYVLDELPYADTVEKLEALLPWNVKAVFES